MSFWSRALVVVGVASSIGLVASCDDGDARPPRDCDYVVRRCRTVCDYYFCDSWGCYPSCFDRCWGECHRDPNKPSGSSGSPAPTDGGATDGSTTGAVLCAPCSSNDECKGGGLCIHRGGAGDGGDTDAGGAADAAPTSTGFCGHPCTLRTDCPAGFTCAEIGTVKQCLPINGKCE